MTIEGFDLTGKAAVVVGGGSGFGKVAAQALAEAGADVAVLSCTSDAAEQKVVEEVAAAVRQWGRKGVAITADITQAGQVNEAMSKAKAELGRIDILVNAPDLVLAKPLVDTTDEEWSRALAVNLTSVFLSTRAAARVMLEQGKGRVVNISSTLGVRGVSNCAAYCAAKGGVVQLTKALSQEWGNKGIRVNGIGPAWFEESIGAGLDESIKGPLQRYISLRRLGQPEEIGALVIYLASDASDIVTGQTIFVDGGVLSHA